MMESYCFTISLYHNVNRRTPYPTWGFDPTDPGPGERCAHGVPWAASWGVPGNGIWSAWSAVEIGSWENIYNTYTMHYNKLINMGPKDICPAKSPMIAGSESTKFLHGLWDGLNVRSMSGFRSPHDIMGWNPRFQGCIQPIQPIQPMEPTVEPWALCGSQGARPRLRLMWRIWSSNWWRARCGFRVYVNQTEGMMIYDVGMTKPGMHFCWL